KTSCWQPVLPDTARRAERRARRAQLPMRDAARQTRSDREAVRKRQAVRAAQRRLQLEGRPQRDAIGPKRPRAGPERGSAYANTAFVGFGAATGRGHPVRPGHRPLRRTRWARVHANEPGARRQEGANMAKHADTPNGQLSVPDEAKTSPTA